MSDNIVKAESIRDEIKNQTETAGRLIEEVRPISDMIETINNHINDTDIHFKKGEKELLNNQIEKIFNLLNILLNENVVYLVDDEGNHFVDDEGNDKFIVLTVKVPTGSRDGEGYDGYSMAEDYAIKCKNKAESAAKKEAEKQKKIARDKKAREKKERG